MRISLLTATLVSGALLCAASAGAGEIYKYTDADGNVHYGDRPTGNPTEQRLAIVSRDTDPAAVQARVEARKERDAARAEARTARDEAATAEAGEREAAEARTAKCEENRSRLETYNQSRRLYREDENGERVYLDDSEREEAMQRVRDLIDEHCG